MSIENTLAKILEKSIVYLEKKNIRNARLVAEKILSNVLKITRLELYTNFDKILNESEKDNIRYSLLNYNENEENNTIEDSIKSDFEKIVIYLNKKNISEAQIIASIIFSKILNVEISMLFTKYKEKLSFEQREKIKDIVKKIVNKKLPIQYIFNEQIFYGHSFYVDKNVLIPRLDTEVVVEKALSLLFNIEKPIVLDIGTGSGAIGITIALENRDSKVLATDISENALNVAKKNSENLGVNNIKFLKSNLFENIEFNKFDLIISNPPYISNEEISLVSENTLLYEPKESLFASNNGLFFYYEIAKNAKSYLKNNGVLLFEIGFKQAKAVKEILENFSFSSIEYGQDLAGNDRWIYGIKKEGLNESK